ncbi:MAG TPA: helix-hairpin-helix domain-containing protein [Propionicimonas sp.]|uniref:helix-hairpin-helix domain-containing protein n=1 Tax=Propionicimonas sp. TaxID=1955623 RepID=UPI002F40EDFD
MKVAPDPVMSDVVRQRLEALLAEVQPRHALPPGGGPGLQTTSVGEPDTVAASGLAPVGAAAGHRPTRAAPAPGIAGAATVVGSRAMEFTREHLAAVVVVLLVGCGWTAYSLLQARSTPVALAAVPTVVAAATAAPTPTPTPLVLVHLLGAVRHPGVVQLPQGARVADAIEEAGGLTAAADPGELNLAAVVVDGSQVVIGTRGKPRGEVRSEGGDAGAGPPGGSATVSLNTATLEQLDTLPGVGPVTAQKILDWRKLHGRFSAVTELQEVDGIGPKTYADIAPNVRI